MPVVGTLIFPAGSTASSLAWNMPALIVFRGFQGLGAGAIMAAVATLAGGLYSVRERAAVRGWLSSVWGIAALAGPLLGGAFAEYASWRWIFNATFTDAWLRDSIALATRGLFTGMAVIAVVMLPVPLGVPRRFPVAPPDAEPGRR